MDPDGPRWTPMGPYGPLWTLMDTDGPWWTLIDASFLVCHNLSTSTLIPPSLYAIGAVPMFYSAPFVSLTLTLSQSIRYLWLNYHTVHHLFPHTDMSHHPAIQQLMIQTAKDFKIK